MIKNAKAKGSRIERKLRDWLLEFQGFDHVLKAGGSLGVFDLIAFGACAIWFVQVKANRWPSPAECEAIRACKVPSNAVKYIARWRDRASEPELRIVADRYFT